MTVLAGSFNTVCKFYDDEREMERELNALRTMVSLKVPVVHLHAVVQSPPCAVFAACDATLEKIGPWVAPHMRRSLVGHVLKATSALRRMSVCHMNISPHHIGIQFGRAVLLDMKTACLEGSEIAAPVGTVGFRHPKLEARGVVRACPEADEFSVASIVVWVYSGVPAWRTSDDWRCKLFRDIYKRGCLELFELMWDLTDCPFSCGAFCALGVE